MTLHRAVLLVAAAVCVPTAADAATSPTVSRKLDLKATLHIVDGKEIGPISGTPFGKGTVTLTVKVDGAHETATYVATFSKGSITGTARITTSPGTVPGDIAFSGTTTLTKATGAFKGATAKDQKVTGLTHAGAIAFRVTGKVRLPVKKG